jgi:hypothetical protein
MTITAAKRDRQQRVRCEIHAIIVAAKEVPCARCSHVFPSVCMDFDHLPEHEKLINIGSPKNWTSVQRIRTEIAKCQVLCSNCHRIVTYERKYARACPEPTWYTPESRDLRICELICLKFSRYAKKIWPISLTQVNDWDRV